MSHSLIRRVALATAVVSCLTLLSNAADKFPAPNSMDISGIHTRPSAAPKLTFLGAGVVSERLVNDGDKVKAGQVLMRQDSDLDQKEAERLKVEAESDSRIEAAEADEKVKQLDYDRKSKAPNGFAVSEIEEAQAKLVEAQKSVKVAQEDKQQAKIKYEQQLVRLQKMELKSPIDGTVQNVVLDVGEMSDPQSKDGACVVVKNDPLWVEIRGLTTRQVSMLKLGDPLQVRYLDAAPNQYLDAKIIYITPLADAGADRQEVRLELPNPDGRAAGLRMELKLPKDLQDAAQKDDAALSFR